MGDPPGPAAAPDAGDDRDRPGTGGKRLRIAGRLALLVATGWLAYRHVRLAWLAEFALDEFQYAHGGWLTGRGGVIYADFFEHHFPLLHHLLGLAWRFLADDPTHILTLRMLYLPVFGLAVACACLLNLRCRQHDDGAAWWTAPALLSVPTLSAMATQLRPDVLGIALFLACLATLRAASEHAGRLRLALAAASGFLAVSALWATPKVAVYAGVPLLAALAVDLVLRRRHRNLDDDGRYLLGHPLGFLAGSSFAAGSIALGLVATGSLAAWWHWAVEFSFAHQEVYPGFGWTKNFSQLLDHSAWLLPLAAAGVVATLRRRPAWPDTDWLLLAAVPATAASFAWQTAPYLYSLIPFTVVAALFAARGVAWSWRACFRRLGGRASPAPLFALLVLALLLAGELRRTDHALVRLQRPGNAGQLETLARLGQMTSPGDAVFSPWAMQVARPSAHFFYFLEAATKRLEAERLRRELVPALRDAGVTVYLHHDLSKRLPPPVRAYLRSHFLPYDPDLWVYGRRYATRSGVATGDFFAVQDGVYFVSPPEALGGQQALRIDGTALDGPIVRLGRGPHRIEYEGDAADVSIVWMPRDGVPFAPRPELLAAEWPD